LVIALSALLSSTLVLCQDAAKTEELPPWLAGQGNETTKTVGDIVGATKEEEETSTPTVKIPGWKKDRMENAALFKETPSDVVISAVLPEPMGRQKEFIQLKNLGGQEQDLKGWRLTLKNEAGGESEETYTFGTSDKCPSKIGPQSGLLLLKKDANNPCGFEFTLGPSEELVLFEEGEGAEGIDSVTWGNIGKGLVLYRSSDDEYEKAPQDVEGGVLDVLRRLGGFNNLITFLDYFELDKILDGRGTRSGHKWYHKIVREMDTSVPYTLFAVKDDAWEKLFKEMAGEWAPPLTAAELLEIDDALVFDIVSFLMVKDAWNSRSLNLKMRDRSSMAFPTAHPERQAVLQLDDAGTIMLNYDCVDSPAPGEFGCAIQKGWGKCQEDWMNDNGFFSGRPLGYCEYECEKCYCDPLDDNCAKTIITDVTASSGKKGVVHVIDRLIEAPPIIKPVEAVEGTEQVKPKKAPAKEDKKKEESSSSSGGSSDRRTYGWGQPWWG